MACVLFVLSSCGPLSPGEPADSGGFVGPTGKPAYYDWNNFVSDQGRYYYYDGDEVVSKTGIDVSEHQDYIDWDAVAADGIEFAFLRIGYRGATEGELYRDEYFEYNLQAAHDAGIECGVYFFSQAVSTQEAHEEAAFVLEMLDGAWLEYPVVFDYELDAGSAQNRTHGVEGGGAAIIARAFCQDIEAAGYEAMLYGSSYDLARFDESLLREFPIWYAEYGSLPSFDQRFEIWQYSNEGVVAGIDGVVDMNLDLSSAV